MHRQLNQAATFLTILGLASFNANADVIRGARRRQAAPHMGRRGGSDKGEISTARDDGADSSSIVHPINFPSLAQSGKGDKEPGGERENDKQGQEENSGEDDSGVEETDPDSLKVVGNVNDQGTNFDHNDSTREESRNATIPKGNNQAKGNQDAFNGAEVNHDKPGGDKGDKQADKGDNAEKYSKGDNADKHDKGNNADKKDEGNNADKNDEGNNVEKNHTGDNAHKLNKGNSDNRGDESGKDSKDSKDGDGGKNGEEHDDKGETYDSESNQEEAGPQVARTLVVEDDGNVIFHNETGNATATEDSGIAAYSNLKETTGGAMLSRKSAAVAGVVGIFSVFLCFLLALARCWSLRQSAKKGRDCRVY